MSDGTWPTLWDEPKGGFVYYPNWPTLHMRWGRDSEGQCVEWLDHRPDIALEAAADAQRCYLNAIISTLLLLNAEV